MEAEFKELEALQEEMIAIIAKVCPNRPRPVDISVVEQEPIDPVRWPHRFRFDASFKVSYEKHRALVLKFPLKSQVHQDILPNKIAAEVGAMTWARSHSALPIPKVRAFDPKGNLPWNTTRRPFILLDHLPGKHITNKDWEQLSEQQRFRVLEAVANVVSALSLHPFDKIGSLYLKDRHGNVEVGISITGPLALYSLKHGSSPQLSALFIPRNSPYPTATEYLIDTANKHLIHRAITSPVVPSKDYVEMWMYRSLIPGLVLEQYNRGPFVLTHGFLDRWALLFDDNYKLTGVIDWGWSQTEPLQIASLIPPFLMNLPIPLYSQEHGNLCGYYINTLAQYEPFLRNNGMENCKVPPILSHLAREGRLLSDAGLVAKRSDDDMSECLWASIFVPTFGETDRKAILELFTKAPGVIEEHKRTTEFLQSLQARFSSSSLN